MSIANAKAPGGVAVHELLISGALGAIMGVLGFYLTRLIGPGVEAMIDRATGTD